MYNVEARCRYYYCDFIWIVRLVDRYRYPALIDIYFLLIVHK